MKDTNTMHPCHDSEVARLNRLGGQVEGIKRMIGDRRYCVDILTQLRAIQSAAKAIESNILKRHLEACVKESMTGKDNKKAQQKIDEIVKLFGKLH